MSNELQGREPQSRTAGRLATSRRLAASVAAGAVLLGGGVAIGVAATGGASAATGTTSSVRDGSVAARHCLKLARRVRNTGHPVAARRIAAFCEDPLLRLALVGGIHGQVTFETRKGAKTLAFERGTVQSVAGSVITVKAPDGSTMTWDLFGKTVVRELGHRVAASSLESGDLVFVAGPVVGGANDARIIRIRPAA